jgi:hypothetical protein
MTKTLYIHKYEVSQQYGGPEEGGWWYEAGYPVKDWQPIEVHLTQKIITPVVFGSMPDYVEEWDDEPAYHLCRKYNAAEETRQAKECKYGYTSVLSSRETFYAYEISESPYPKAYPEVRPHYE